MDVRMARMAETLIRRPECSRGIASQLGPGAALTSHTLSQAFIWEFHIISPHQLLESRLRETLLAQLPRPSAAPE